MRGTRAAAVVLVVVLVAPTFASFGASEGGGRAISVSRAEDLTALGLAIGLGTKENPWILKNLVIEDPNATAISITGLPDGHLVLRDVTAHGRIGVFVSGVKSLTIQNLTVGGVEAGILQDIEELKVDRIEATAADTAIVVGGIKKGEMKDLRVKAASDGLVLSDYTGTVVLGDLRVAGNGVLADGFRGYIQNILVQGECGGTGLTFSGGNPNLIGNAAHCREAGIRIEGARNATMNGDGAAFGDAGIVVRDTPMDARGLVVRHVAGIGLDIEGADARLDAVSVTGAQIGIRLAHGSFTLRDAKVEDIDGEAVDVRGARLCEHGGAYSSARVGMRLRGVEGTIAGNCIGGALLGGGGLAPTGTTTIRDVETGVDFATSVIDAGTLTIDQAWGDFTGVRAGLGARNGTFAWQQLKVTGAGASEPGVGVHAFKGADLALKKFDGYGLHWAGRVTSGARLKITDGGSLGDNNPVGNGFRVMDRAVLDLRHMGGGYVEHRFVDANDSFVRDQASSVGWYVLNGVEPRSAEEGFRLVRTDARLNGTVIHRTRLAIYAEGLPEAEPGKQPQHVVLSNLNLRENREGGIHLVDTAAEIVGGTISDSGTRRGFLAQPPHQGAHGILAERSGFVLGGGLLVNRNDGDGLRWIPPQDGVPASTLFPPNGAGKSNEVTKIGNARLEGNVGNGLTAAEAPRGLGFVIDGASLSFNKVHGAELRDVNVQIANSKIASNGRHGLQSRWTDAATEEVFEVRNVTFNLGTNPNNAYGGNDWNALDLDGHGESTVVAKNIFDDSGVNLGLLLPEASYGHHVALWNSTRGKGPLIADNRFGDSYYCAVKLNQSNGRVHDNAFRSIISSSGAYEGFTCGLFAQRVQAYEFKGNRVGALGLVVLSLNSSGLIASNKVNLSTIGLAWVEGDGTNTVTIRDNTVVSGARQPGTPRWSTDMYASANCELPVAVICWSNVKGSIEHNLLDAGESATEPRCPVDPWVTLRCRLGAATREIFIRRGPQTPEIAFNNITTKGFGIDLWAPAECYCGTLPRDRTLDVGFYYDSANRIHDNVFDTYIAAGDTTTRPTAINDAHGAYWSSERNDIVPPRAARSHDAPTGANVRGNTFVKGVYVECHYYTVYNAETGQSEFVREPIDCADTTGRQRVVSHNFGPGTVAAAGTGPRAYTPSSDLRTRERLPSDLKTQVRPFPSVDRGYALGEPVLTVTPTGAERTFRFHGAVSWTEAGQSYGAMRDSETDIVVQFLVDGQVVATFSGADAAPQGEKIRRGNVTYEWRASGERLYEVVLRVTLASKARLPDLANQRVEDREAAWAGSGPHIEKVESNRGTVFLQGVPIPGGVKITAKVHWPAATEGGYVVFKYGGKEHRAFGRRPSIVAQPPLDFPETLANPADGLGLSGAVIHAQAFAGQGESAPATLRLKLLPFPLALLELVSRGETKVSFYELSPGVPGKEKVVYDWDLLFWSFEKKVKVPIPGFEGKYEGKTKAGAKLKLDTTGPGYVGIRGLLEFSREPEGIRPGDAFKFTGSIVGGGIAEIDDVKLKGIFLQPKLEGDLTIAIMIVDIYPVLKGVAQIPLVGRAITELNSRVRIEMGIGAAAEGLVKLEAKPGSSCVKADWKCSGELKIQPRFTVALVGKITDDIKAKAYGRGSFYVTGKIPGDTFFVGAKEMGLDGELGLELKAYSYEKKWKTNLALVIASPGRGFNVSDETEWHIPPRNWTDGGTFRGLADHVVANLTRDGDPAFAFAPDGRAAVAWIRDDTAKPYPRSGEVAVAVRDDAGTWQDLGPITSDELLDARPSIAPLANGRWLVTWTRDTDAALSTSTPLSASTGLTFETMAAVVAPGSAGPPVALTSNGLLDSGATALAAPDGGGLVVWSQNAQGSLVSTPDAPDDVWAAVVTPAGSIGAPVKVFAGETMLGRAFAWDGARLTLAGQLPNGTVALRSAIPGLAATTTFLGSSGGAPPTTALLLDGPLRRVAWLRANATNNMSFDLVESDVDGAGGVAAARTIANDAGPEDLTFAPGSSRALVWTEPRNGTAVRRAVAGPGGWGPAEDVGHAPGFVELLAARNGASLQAAVLETRLAEVTGSYRYRGPNVDQPSETIDLTRVTTSLVPAGRDVRLLALTEPPAPSPPAYELEVVAADAAETEPGKYRVTARIRNNGTVPSAAFTGALSAGPYDGAAVATVPVHVPAVAPGGNGTVEGTIAIPADASGWWRVNVTGRGLAGLPAVLRLAPEWVLDGADVNRAGGTIDFVLRNHGPRAGSTLVKAFPIRADGSLGPALADVNVAVPAANSTSARLTVPAGTGPVLLMANPPRPGVEIDQGDFGPTAVIAAGNVGLFEFAGNLTVPAGVHPFRIDLKQFAGTGSVLSATLDGAPLPVTVAGGVVTGTATITEGVHAVAVTVSDLVGGERTLRLIVRTPGATDALNPDDDGDGKDEDASPPPSDAGPQPWWKRVFAVPSSAPLLQLAALLLATILWRSWRRQEP